MARGNDLTPETPFYCEVEGCERVAVRVEGSPVYHFLCTTEPGPRGGELGHAELLGLHVVDGFVPRPAPTRTMPLAVFDGWSDALGRHVRAAPLEQLIVALEDVLASPDPLEQLRQLVAAMRVGATAEPEAIPSVIAPGF